MKIIIQDEQPDGLSIHYEGKFLFNTWEEAFKFIIAVEKANGWQGDVEIRQRKFVLSETKGETKK